MRTASIALSLTLALAAAHASAAVLYKLTDSSGHVTYVDAVPRGFTGSVQRMDIDTGERVISLQEPVVRELRSLAENEEIIRRRPPVDPGIERARAARLKAAAARSALESAQNNSTPEDWIYFPGAPRAAARVRGAPATAGARGRRRRRGSAERRTRVLNA